MQLAVNLFTGPLGDFEIRTSKKKFQTMILSARFSAFRMCFILCPKDETISMPKSLTLTDSLGNIAWTINKGPSTPKNKSIGISCLLLRDSCLDGSRATFTSPFLRVDVNLCN